jgi:HK97 family phage major capsid protein
MAYALALQEDNEMVNGTGAGATYFGVRGLLNKLGAGGKATADTGDSTWDTLDMDDFTAVIGLLPERFQNGMLKWVCSSNFYHGCMLRVLAEAGGNTIATLQAGPSGRQFLGYPVEVTSQMATSTAVSQTCALFGNFQQAVILGDRTGIRIQRDDSVGFLSDLITLRATSRYDINVYEPGTASAAGAYVGLVTAAS